jgi:hypothetical protein
MLHWTTDFGQNFRNKCLQNTEFVKKSDLVAMDRILMLATGSGLAVNLLVA